MFQTSEPRIETSKFVLETREQSDKETMPTFLGGYSYQTLRQSTLLQKQLKNKQAITEA